MKHSNSNILEFKSTKNPIKVLGTFLSYNQNKNIEENFLSRIRKMKTKLHLWLSRDLTLYIEPTGIKAWKVNYADTYTEWKNNFSFIFQSTRDNKLRQFSFRLLHRNIVTKKELLKF